MSDSSDPAVPAPGEPAPGPEGAAPPARRPRRAGFDDQGRVRRTRSGAAWVGLVAAALLMVLLLVFILQNADPVSFRYFGWEGEMPLAVAVLLSAVVGILLVAIPGSIRILQLRRALVKNQKDAQRD